MRKGARFAIGTALIGGATYALLSFAMPLLQQLTAMLASLFLLLFGASSSQGASLVFNSLSAQIVPLCVGDIEIAVLVGAIASTADRKIRDRVYGVIGAFVFVMLINALRIAATMLAWQWFGFEALEAVHSVLFRVVLVVAIVGYYAAWYLRKLAWQRLKLRRLLTER